MPDTNFENLIAGFYHAVRHFADRPALQVQDQIYSYGALSTAAALIKDAILTHEPAPKPLACILAQRSPVAYQGVLGILASGKGYVPLHPGFPAERTLSMLRTSNANVLVAGNEALDVLDDLLAQYDHRLAVILPDTTVSEAMCRRHQRHTLVGHEVLHGGRINRTPPQCRAQDIAYALFTSGSTGTPKGVPVRQRNVTAYLTHACQHCQVTEQDRVSQAFDLTFDLSVHDLFVSWWSGACLNVLPQRSVMAPAKFIRDHALTLWFSVPSVVAFMSRMKILKEGIFPSLRLSLFCGEPLSATCAAQWQMAAPNSVVENLYGPTEATIAISHFRWGSPDTRCHNDIVPIGRLFSGQRGMIVDADLKPVAAGQVGELCLAGSQVTDGYLNCPEKTRQQFVHLAGESESLWYRTGDRVEQDEDGCLHYRGRLDQQVQILGHRVELQEIDQVLREALRTELAVAVAWPVRDGRAEAVYGFSARQNGFDETSALKLCRTRLPEYMVPRRIFHVPELPRNANGKTDRNALAAQVEALLHGT